MAMGNGTATFRRLDFESDLLGVGVFRLPDAPALADAAAVAGIVRDLAAAGCWLAMTRVPESDRAKADALTAGGFRAIETLLILECPLADTTMEMPAGINVAAPADGEACADVAHAAFHMDRLHRDPDVPDAVADTVRRAWVMNDVGGRADATFVSKDGGKITGFNACLRGDGFAVIDLIAVAPGQQGKGLGGKLVEASLAHYAGRVPMLRVGTQADNTVSVRMYEAAGFKPVKREITFHRVFDAARGKRAAGGAA